MRLIIEICLSSLLHTDFFSIHKEEQLTIVPQPSCSLYKLHVATSRENAGKYDYDMPQTLIIDQSKASRARDTRTNTNDDAHIQIRTQ